MKTKSKKITSPAKKNKKSKQDDVFGLITHADNMKTEVVILKSKAIANMIKDGMDEEEAQEYWDFNITGSYGNGSYSCVDDTLELSEIVDILDNDDTIVNPPYTGRPYITETSLLMMNIEKIVLDKITPTEKIKALKDLLQK